MRPAGLASSVGSNSSADNLLALGVSAASAASGQQLVAAEVPLVSIRASLGWHRLLGMVLRYTTQLETSLWIGGSLERAYFLMGYSLVKLQYLQLIYP